MTHEQTKFFNKQKYGWSKWGEPHMGLVQKNLTEEWYCQSCGLPNPNQLTPYMFEFPEREYVRICSGCHFLRLKNKIERLQLVVLRELACLITSHVDYVR